MIELEPTVYKYYQGLEAGKLLGKRCPECGHVEFPPRPACNACGYIENEWCEVSGKGQMTSFVMPGMLSSFQQLKDASPFCLAHITLEEGTELNGIVFGVTKDMEEPLKDRIRAGETIPVEAFIADRPEGFKTVYFKMVEG